MCNCRRFDRLRAGIGVFVLVCFAVLCSEPGLPSSAQTTSPPGQPQAPTITSAKKQPETSKDADSKDRKSAADAQGVGSEPPAKGVSEAVALSAPEKERFLRSAVEDILIGADRVNSVEHSILVQVEAATLLWEIDRDRANSVLRGAFEKFRGLLEKKNDAKSRDVSAAENERVRAAILRKVARLDPNLIKELIADKTDGEKNRPAIVTNWTEEARAVLAVADEEIDRNPAAAAKLALKSLSFGTVSLPSFLLKLARRDRPLAEQQAMILLSQLRDSSVSPLYLLGFASFVFSADNGSAQLRDYYFESVAIRIRRGVRPDVDVRDVEDLVNAARAAGQQARGYPRWQTEFAQIVSDFESLLATRSQPVPAFPSPRAVEMPKSATEGDTRDIAEAAERLENIRDPRVRDKEYKKLAVSAANKADEKLAEKLVSKIEDEDARRKASIDIYSPFVRKALDESDWAAARGYALKVSDPLGRSLVVDWVGQKVTGAKQNKELVKELYDAALAQLRHDSPTPEVALGFLALARSTFGTDREGSLDAMRWAVYVLNKTVEARSSSGGPELGGELGTWVRRQGSMLSPEETLDMTAIIGPTFSEIGRRDWNQALTLASGLSDRSLSLLAKLGVMKVVAEEVRNSKKPVKDSKQGARNN